MGDPSYATMSLSKEKKLGKVILAKLRSSLPLVKQIELQEYLNSVSYRVLSYDVGSPLDFYFLLTQNKAINAFATPGGVIAINSGLITHADNEDEVAGIIAHEIAHIQHRHIARLYALSDQTKWSNALQLIASLIVSAYNPQVGQLGLAATASGSTERYLSHSRVFEKEADYSAIKLLYNAGYDPQGMVSFFTKLQSRSNTGGGLPEFLRTHPLNIDRLINMQQRAKKYPRQGIRNTQSKQDFAYAKAALQAVSETKAKYSGEAKHIDFYRRGVRLTERGFPYEAMQNFNKIDKDYWDSKMVGIAIVKTLILQNKKKEAEKILRRLKSLYPESVSVSYYLARTLLLQKRPQQARDTLKSTNARILKKICTPQQHYPQLIKMNAEIAAALQKPFLNHEYLSNYYCAMGKTDLALKQLKLAEAAAKENPVGKQRIAEKRKMVLKLKKEMEE